MRKILFTKNREIETDKVVVKQIGFNEETLESFGIGYEVIDLETNKMFKDSQDEWDIEDTYESFWNRLNSLDTGWVGHDIIKVIKVYPYNEFIENGGEEHLKMKGFHKVKYSNVLKTILSENKHYQPITW